MSASRRTFFTDSMAMTPSGGTMTVSATRWKTG
jgi:hypothetical protein